jgi:hypothetical protein
MRVAGRGYDEIAERFSVEPRMAHRLVEAGGKELPADRWERGALIGKIMRRLPKPPTKPLKRIECKSLPKLLNKHPTKEKGPRALGEVMLRFTSFFILFVGFAAAADAEWLSTSGEDPMTDKRWAGDSAMFSPMGLPSVLFKCWEGGELQLGIVVGRYDDSASYAPMLTAKFRVDKGEAVDILAQPQNLNGFLSLSATSVDIAEEHSGLEAESCACDRRRSVPIGCPRNHQRCRCNVQNMRAWGS